jgi:hypothetical protein
MPPFMNGSNLRDSHFGCLSIYANANGTAATLTPKGELYYEMDYEFYDFVPIAGAASIPFSLDCIQQLMLDALDREQDESKVTSYEQLRKIWESKAIPHARLPGLLSSFYNLVPKPSPSPPTEEKEVFEMVGSRETARFYRAPPTKESLGPYRTKLVGKGPLRAKPKKALRAKAGAPLRARSVRP